MDETDGLPGIPTGAIGCDRLRLVLQRPTASDLLVNDFTIQTAGCPPNLWQRKLADGTAECVLYQPGEYVRPSICPSTRPSVHPSIHPSIHPPIDPSAHPSARPPTAFCLPR